MIDTYMDHADRITGYRPTPAKPVSEDPRYFAGQLYATVIDRMVAEARSNLRYGIENMARFHKQEMASGIKVGDRDSWYRADGRRK